MARQPGRLGELRNKNRRDSDMYPPPRRSRPAEVQEPAVQTAAPETPSVSATVTESDGMFTGIIKKRKIKKKHSVAASGSGEESIWGPVLVSQASSGWSQPLCAAGPSSVSVDSGSQGQAHPPHAAAPGDSELGGSAKAESQLGRDEPSCSGKAEDVSTSSHAGAVAV
ncbi:UNVERIFIED_CONTAM: hypothetical protein FKN15_009689 [Acipenser sinensis]